MLGPQQSEAFCKFSNCVCVASKSTFPYEFPKNLKFRYLKTMFRARLPSIFITSHKMPRLPRNLHAAVTMRFAKKTRNATRLKCCACHAKWRWRSPKCCACREKCNSSSQNNTKVLHLPHKTTLDMYETRWNVTMRLACHAKRGHATFATSKSPKVTTFAELAPFGPHATAADGCRRLRNVWRTQPQPPKPPEWNGNPCYAFGKNKKIFPVYVWHVRACAKPISNLCSVPFWSHVVAVRIRWVPGIPRFGLVVGRFKIFEVALQSVCCFWKDVEGLVNFRCWATQGLMLIPNQCLKLVLGQFGSVRTLLCETHKQANTNIICRERDVKTKRRQEWVRCHDWNCPERNIKRHIVFKNKIGRMRRQDSELSTQGIGKGISRKRDTKIKTSQEKAVPSGSIDEFSGEKTRQESWNKHPLRQPSGMASFLWALPFLYRLSLCIHTSSIV